MKKKKREENTFFFFFLNANTFIRAIFSLCTIYILFQHPFKSLLCNTCKFSIFCFHFSSKGVRKEKDVCVNCTLTYSFNTPRQLFLCRTENASLKFFKKHLTKMFIPFSFGLFFLLFLYFKVQEKWNEIPWIYTTHSPLFRIHKMQAMQVYV